MLFGFNADCDDFDKWMQEKVKQLNADNRDEPVEAIKRKFEVNLLYFCNLYRKPIYFNEPLLLFFKKQIVTDLSASRSRLDDLTRRADELLGAKSAPAANVRARVKAIQDRWESLNKLRQAKERSLKGASRYN